MGLVRLMQHGSKVKHTVCDFPCCFLFTADLPPTLEVLDVSCNKLTGRWHKRGHIMLRNVEARQEVMPLLAIRRHQSACMNEHAACVTFTLVQGPQIRDPRLRYHCQWHTVYTVYEACERHATRSNVKHWLLKVRRGARHVAHCQHTCHASFVSQRLCCCGNATVAVASTSVV